MARREDTRSKRGGVSLDSDDAIDVGLFSSGPARVVESIFTTYDYQGTSRKPPLVWLLTYERGEGKEKERYEQPYGIGKGWGVDKDGLLVPKNGQTGLPKSCNAIMYLVKPLKKALADAKLELDLSGDPSVLEGMNVVVERIEQEERDIRNDRSRDRDRDRDRGPRTILVIDEVVELPSGKSSSKSKRRDDDDDDDKDEKPRRGASRGKDDDDSDDALTEEAVEAVIAVVEKGPVSTGEEFEDALAKVVKKHRQSGAIIDLATTPKFLAQEKGWTYDKKKGIVDAAESSSKDDDDDDDDEKGGRSRHSSPRRR